MRLNKIVGALAMLACAAANAQIVNDTVKIGVLSDFTGPSSSWGGKGSVLATEMAIDDFKKAHPGIKYKIEVVQGDFQLKPDLAVAIARKWMDEGVNAIIDMPASAAGLAVNGLVKGTAVAALITGAAHNDLVTKECNANMVHWTYDQYSITKPTVQALTQGGKSWYFLTVDAAGGKAQEDSARTVIAANNGKVLGSLKNPYGSSDFSSQLMQAQASKADVIGILQSGSDTVNAIKQAQEFGIMQGQAVTSMFTLISDIGSMGLATAQGLTFTEAFYWDTNERTRAFSKRFGDKFGGKMPTSVQAGAYSAVSHYLKAVDAAKSNNGPVVVAKMKELPIDDDIFGKSKLREDGRLVHDMVLVQVKKPAESKSAWDLYKIVRTIPGDDAFRPMSKECSLVK